MSKTKATVKTKKEPGAYDASSIEVLEGLEAVRKRPGMYIGGTDENALHHLASEILDNSMDEAVAGYADTIEIALQADHSLIIRDNGRGIPVDEHPKFKNTSALEVILTTLHSGGKFSDSAYQTSGGLHGVGISVVNALSDRMWVEVARDKTLYRQDYARGIPQTKLQNKGAVARRGTAVGFHPDPDIFGKKAHFKPAMLHRMARSKAYLYSGVKIKWLCDPALLPADSVTPAEDVFHFPGGLKDFLIGALDGEALVTPELFAGRADLPDKQGYVEFAIGWTEDGEGFLSSYCNTIPTPQGGTHESGLRTALGRALRAYGDMTGNKKTAIITAEDIFSGAGCVLSVFVKNPQFQGQTKEKLASAEVAKWVDTAVKDHFDHWLTKDPAAATKLLDSMIERAEERQRRRDDKSMARKSATRKLRLPGKLADCSRTEAEGTEIFIVEGDSAGGSAKQGRNRETQAILPLRGKILNVVSATNDKMRANQEIQDLILALGCGAGKDFKLENLRYERVIIMTDADVDGAHIASLLITFFFTQMRALVTLGHLYLAQPPLYRLVSGTLSEYAQDDAHKEKLLQTVFKGKSKVDISRFKGLGEMPASQLKDTTMNPKTRTLLRVTLPGAAALIGSMTGDGEAEQLVERLMGKNAEHRFQFIQDNAQFVQNIDV